MQRHGTELRRRLVVCLLGWLAAGVGLFLAKGPILAFLLLPLGGVPVQATGVAELFLTYLRLAAWGGVLVACPLWLWQMGAFLAPGLYPKEKRFLFPTMVAIPVLFYAGAAFAFFVLIPLMLNYLLGFSQPEVLIQPKLADYISFLVSIMLAVGGAFLLPLVLVLLMAWGIITPAQLKKARRWVVIGVFIVAAIVTPPDPFSQTALAIPLLLLYEVAVFIGTRLKPKTA